MEINGSPAVDSTQFLRYHGGQKHGENTHQSYGYGMYN